MSQTKVFLLFRSNIKAKELRATLVQDNVITMAKIVKLCESRLTAQVNAENAAAVFGLIDYFAMLRQIKTDKKFCAKCSEASTHAFHELAQMAVNIYLKLIDNGLNETITEQFARIVRINFETISKSTCEKALMMQCVAVNAYRSVVSKCDSKEKAIAMLPLIRAIVMRHKQINLLDGVKNFCTIVNLHDLLSALQHAEQRSEMLDVGYLLLAMILNVPKSPYTFDGIAWKLANAHKDCKEFSEIRTPFDFFNNIKKESLYGLKLPDNFDLNHITCEFLSVDLKYNAIPTAMTNKILHQLLMTSSKSANPLRFALFVKSMNFDKLTSERVEKLVKAQLVHSKQDKSIALQMALIKYLQFNCEAKEFTQKYNDFSLSEVMKDEEVAKPFNIFHEVTFDQEMGQIKTLRIVKEAFIDFTKFYLKQTEEQRTAFEHEKNVLLREFKMIANQFIVRGFLADGMDLLLYLYKLSKEINDDFGKINAFSCIAENSSTFKQQFPDEDIEQIAGNIFVMVFACFDR